MGRKISNYCSIWLTANCSRAQNQHCATAAHHPRQSSLKLFPKTPGPLDWQNLVCIPEVALDLGSY